MPSDEVLVSCADAALTFGRGAQAVVAVHGADLEIRAGDRLAVVGPSGPGKSSLLHLDLGLPDMDGLDVARRLRARLPDLLIVVLTARTDDIDIVAGLDAGADDYLVKPFSLTVLLARLRAHLRRRVAPVPAREPVRLGDLVVDVAARRCALLGVDVPLRAEEFDLLAVLAARVGEAVSRETLMAEVWDENWFGSTKTLDVTLAGLRRRLTEAAQTEGRQSRLPRITTLRGHGYRLEQQPDPPD
ncbi:winged helix-turn-helix domain-containing protein [Streptomyces sp. NPDC013157]|uniref:winged helix-turn-helix domain-containing protein n=1 Tax=Streptomyces sp. NPDC013157 TaxID=3364861 RepID=UPI00367C9205